MLIDFLKTQHTKEELATTLDVLRAFRNCESDNEYLTIDFAAWAKLEQLQEYLEHLVEGSDLKDDTLAQVERYHNE